MLMLFMIIGLFISGITVFPVETELNLLLDCMPVNTSAHQWISFILNKYIQLQSEYPQYLYGYDWLGFAHIVLAILFIGPYKDPVRNVWIIQFGIIASLLIFPFAFIAGYCRQIPIGWQLIDCSFGVAGFFICGKAYRNIQNLNNNN